MNDINGQFSGTLPDGSVYDFKSFDQVKAWAEKEKEAWEAFITKCDTYPWHKHGIEKSQLLAYLRENQLHPISHLINGAFQYSDAREKEIRIRHSFELFYAHNYLSAQSPKGLHVFKIQETDLYQSVLLLAAWNPLVFPLQETIQGVKGNIKDKKKSFSEYIQGLAVAALFDQGIKNSTRSEKAALSKIRGEAEGLINEYKEKYKTAEESVQSANEAFKSFQTESRGKVDSSIKTFEEEIEKIKEKHKQEIEKIRDFYREELALQTPVEYWSHKAGEHASLLRGWAIFFTGLIVSCLLIFPSIFEYIIHTAKELLTSTENDAIVLFFVISFPAFLAIWVLRLISRTLLSHQAQMHDAKHRVTMTKTFLALMSENKANDNDRILILNALFQPLSNAGDDGSPPHWFEILQERLKNVGK